jgi:hypothetical protein
MNYYMDVNVTVEQRRDELREIETSRLLRRAGIDRRSWLRVQADKALCRLSEVLVTLEGRSLCREPESRTAFSTFVS